MGKASRRKRERNNRSFFVDEATEMEIAAGMLDLIRASSVIADPIKRRERERSIEAGFLEKFSCHCRPPCGAPVQVPSMFDKERGFTLVLCEKGDR